MTAQQQTASYPRRAVRRLLRLNEAQLNAFERQGLIQPAENYGFHELLALRTLIQLRKDKVPAAQIQRAIQALRKTLDGVDDPLRQLKLYAHGKKVRVEVQGRKMDAASGQLLLDFDAKEINRLLEFRRREDVRQERSQRAEAEHWFQQGLELEQTGAPTKEVISAYLKAVELDPKTAGALVNLGTVFFNARKWTEAELYYRKAVEADPNYALAHFNLGNLYDERGDYKRAMEQYQGALRASPTYADAHYNLALLYQSTNQPMHAVRHWNAYLKLDPSSEWAVIARRELGKLRNARVVSGQQPQ